MNAGNVAQADAELSLQVGGYVDGQVSHLVIALAVSIILMQEIHASNVRN